MAQFDYPVARVCWLIAVAVGMAGCATSEPLQPVSNPLPALSDTAYEVTQVTSPPVARLQISPRYPVELRKKGISGKAEIVFTVGSDGLVRDVSVLTATDGRFGEAAMEAVRQWTFQPAQIAGRYVNCRLAIPISFKVGEE